MGNNTSETEPVDAQPVAQSRVVSGGFSKSRRKRIIWVAAGIVVLAGILALVFGFVAIVFKYPTQKVVLVGAVCDAVTIDHYNTAMQSYYGDDRAAALKTLSTLSDDIAKRSGAGQDASCLFIRYRTGLLSGNYTVAKENFDLLSRQEAAGNSPALRLDGLSSLTSMQRDITTIDPNIKAPDDL